MERKEMEITAVKQEEERERYGFSDAGRKAYRRRGETDKDGAKSRGCEGDGGDGGGLVNWRSLPGRALASAHVLFG